jgi:hypothetical protein
MRPLGLRVNGTYNTDDMFLEGRRGKVRSSPTVLDNNFVETPRRIIHQSVHCATLSLAVHA